MTQATVGADLLEALQVVTELHVEGVRDALRELAILRVLLAVEHPVRHLELARVLHDRHKPLDLLSRKLARTEREKRETQRRGERERFIPWRQ